MKKLMDNKLISGVAIILCGLLMSWGVWITNGIFKADKTHEISSTIVKSIRSDIDRLQVDTKEIRIELKEQREMIFSNQEKIMEKLSGISSFLKKDEKGKR